MSINTDYFDLFSLPVSERIRYYQHELEQITPPKSFRDQVLANVYRCLLAQYTSQLPLEPLIKEQLPQHSTATIHYLHPPSRPINDRSTVVAYHRLQLNRNQTSH